MKVFFDTIGCRLNQSEIERMASQARLNGHEVVSQASQADFVIINTCAVTSAASADSRKKIRQAARSGDAKIITTGCYATIAPDELLKLEGVQRNFPNSEKEAIIERILGIDIERDREEINPRIALPGRQHRTRAFIKVQDGCDNFCTFCLTRIARGKSRSQTEAEIFHDVESALAGGVKEIVLTGVNLGSWSRDLTPPASLPNLIQKIVKDFSPQRLRLSSLEPWDITDEFLEVLELPGFCRHLHLPLQSGSGSVLKRMGRRNTPQDFQKLVEKIRKAVPEIALTTDIMVGFPGETEQEFQESLDFIRSLQFAGGHVFNYSVRPGTAGEQLPDRVPAVSRKRRSIRMREVFESSRKAYQLNFVNSKEEVLWERTRKINGQWVLDGLTDTYIRVQTIADRDLWNMISSVKLMEITGQYMTGILPESSKMM
jgi:threonylcarbamoyladenosine tRNA methylthiotransferase MtaB